MARKANTAKYVLTQKGIKKVWHRVGWGLSVLEWEILELLDRRRKLGLSREELGRRITYARSTRIAYALKVLIRKGFVKRL